MVICKICGYETNNSLQAHLNNKHNILNKQYIEMFPDATIYSQFYSDRLKYTNAHRDISYKKKLSENARRLYQNCEWAERHREALKRGQNTQEAKNNHRRAATKFYQTCTMEQRGYHKNRIIESWKDPLKRKNRVTALKGAHCKSEVRENHSIATKKFLDSLTPEERLLRNKNLKKIWAIPENREKILGLAKMGLEAAMSPEGRKNFYEANKSPLLREKRRKAAIKNLLNKPIISSLNISFKEALHDAGLCPLPEYPVGPYVVDFCFPDKKLIIEVDGDFWHANPDLYSHDKLIPIQQKTVNKDKREASFIENINWKLVRLWEKDINENISACIKKVQDLYEQKN